jgi:hypothetical protein
MTTTEINRHKEAAELRLNKLAAESRRLLTEPPSDSLWGEIVDAIANGQAKRSCPGRIAAKMRPVIASLVPVGSTPVEQSNWTAVLASHAVNEMLWPAPKLMDEEEAEGFIRSARGQGPEFGT